VREACPLSTLCQENWGKSKIRQKSNKVQNA
jgi:hypothetical protein